MTLQVSARIFKKFATPTRRGPLRIQAHEVHPFSQTFRPLATQGYGDGQGDPKAEKPQKQGSSTSAQSKAEHPGPESPAKDSNTGSTTKASRDSSSVRKNPSEASASSGGSRTKETGSSPTGGDIGGGESTSKQGNNYKPKISDMSAPRTGNPEQQAEVERHNKEFEQRYDKAPKAVDDKVDKKFWSG